MKLIQSVAPVSEPVTLAEMKAHLRVLHSDDDSVIKSLITAAREKAESIMNIQIMPATYELYFDVAQSEITLHRPPFVSLTSVQAYDGAIWNDVTDYDLDDKISPAEIYVSSWTAVASTKNSVKVVYKAGYADAASVPESIKAWIRIEVGYMYDEESKRINVDSLLSSFRIIPL